MKKYRVLRILLVLFVFTFSISFDAVSLAFTKDEGEILDWTLLDDTVSDSPFVETTIQTFATELDVFVVVTVAHADTNDAADNDVFINLAIRMGSDNKGWRRVGFSRAGGGQAGSQILAAASGVSEANPERIEVADTTDFDTGSGEFIFLKDVNVLSNSTLVLVKGWSDNDYYINAWSLAGDYDNADLLINGVWQSVFRIPAGAQFFNITFHNSDNDATYAVRADFVEVPTIE